MIALRGALRSRVLAAGLLSVALLSPEASGEPSDPSAFYQKNFAEAPEVGGEAMRAPESSHSARKESPQQQQSGASAPSQGEGAPSRPQAGGKTEETRSLLSLYVSSQSKGHFESVVRKAFRVAESNRNVRLTEIFHIGDYRNVPPSIESDAKAKGIILTGIASVPSIWPVTDSPVWVLRDSTGEHIVEGLLQIERCITPQGEYREPERSMFEPPATPTIGVKSF